MNLRIKKIIKFIYICFIIFTLINMTITPVALAVNNATPRRLTKVGATIVKGLIAFSEVLVFGYFVIRFTITGIQYFTATAVTEKTVSRNKMKWTFIYGVLALLGMYLFSYAVGLN